ncbi:type II toxin-antitoxin system PemK/MazF family toxin [Rickettsia endosymbiont of Halotydeus destructor]|uniref:type II toxin-antitoxin system PemK/MazF family toxin n=1 Tax=Rickettsia endosymbiont of Halotydeus destructor TaxID=2996754 RepID=UPI003BAF5378
MKAVDQLEKDSDLLIDQIRAIDNKRLRQGPFTKFNKDFMQRVNKAIFDVIGEA